MMVACCQPTEQCLKDWLDTLGKDLLSYREFKGLAWNSSMYVNKKLQPVSLA